MKVKLNTGLQARPAYELVNVSQKYSSDVYIQVDNRKINCKSIMGVMSLGLAPNVAINLIVDGYDEESLLDELTTRFFKDEDSTISRI
ncbi:HPr family phosphocarrier protein [Halalkalibacter kiskunsagensis]|uniref:HPr family phosphocarrier protein n=1 Tax=Halalkalibacter kiskunsagensis TaxID=1548599 RepID=A0ABV6KBF1_9BACI